MLGNSSAFRLTGRALIVAALIGATLAVAPAIGAQVTQGECAGEAVTVNLALGQSPTEDADVILGTAGADLINGLGGNDIICGEGGDDIINAGNGADTVFGGAGDDSINAGQGRDTIYGQGGDDFISGGKGKDTLNGGAGSDELRGNNGTDTINGGTGSDNINGGQKADTLNGDNGDDTIIGGTRPDTIDGGPGQDTINGGGGQDTCLRDLRDLNVICETLTSGPAPTGDLISGDFADDEITVGVFGNPTMEDIIRLTPDFFSADGGADVNFVLLDQQTARDILALDSTDFDALMVGAFDTPQFGQNGWIRDLTDAVDSDPAYGADDIIPSVRATNSTDEGFFGLPFYAESSFIMYNQQIMDDAGIAVPEEPTWDEIAQIARAVDTDEHAGICLRGLAGWVTSAHHSTRSSIPSAVHGGKPTQTAHRGRHRSTKPTPASERRSSSTQISSGTLARTSQTLRASRNASNYYRPAKPQCGSTQPSPPTSSKIVPVHSKAISV